MKILNIICLLLIICNLSANSVFSHFGMPVKNYGEDVYGMGMGETGSADLFRINSNFSNPSMLVSSNKVLFSTAAQLGNIWYKDDAGNKFKDDGFYLPYFRFALPLADHRVGFTFDSFASGNLETEIEQSFTDSVQYTSINRLQSNLFKVSFVYAFKNELLNIGFAANYLFGHRISYWKLDYEDDDYTDAKYEIEKTFKQPGFSVGINKKINNFSLGASYSSAVELTGEEEYKFNHYPGSEVIGTDVELWEYPAEGAGGLTYKFADKFKASLDVKYEFWQDLAAYDANSYKLGMGFAYDPLSGYGDWYNQIPLRLGAYFRELPFKVNNSKVTEQAVTAGFSIPLQSPDKKFDFGFKYMQRGNVDDHGLADESIMFSIGITGFDIFRKRPKKIAPRDIPEADEDFIQEL